MMDFFPVVVVIATADWMTQVSQLGLLCKIKVYLCYGYHYPNLYPITILKIAIVQMVVIVVVPIEQSN